MAKPKVYKLREDQVAELQRVTHHLSGDAGLVIKESDVLHTLIDSFLKDVTLESVLDFRARLGKDNERFFNRD
jgi:hypothetical protein